MSLPLRPPALDERAPRPALVVFVDHVECPWLRGLKRGFRHCFAVLADGPGWLLCDPLKDRILLTRIEPPAGFDLARFYHEQGHRVLAGRTMPVSSPRRPPTLVPLTCVAVVKRLLGVQGASVLTPRQLFDHLARPPQSFVEVSGGLDSEGQ
jgi:hypothetical protein